MDASPVSRLNKRRLIGLAVASVALAIAGLWRAGVLFPPAAIVHATIDVGGMRREYRLVMPRSVAGKRDVPVVFALHGANDTVDEMAGYTGLDELAIEQGFLLVYLQGRHLNWPPFIPPENPTLMEPDAAFLRAMCDRVASEHGGDPRRIYLLGVSQGGAAANLLTAMCSERLAATVVGCGWLPEPLGDAPLATANKCPMLFLVGSRDRQAPPEMVREGRDAFERAGHPVEFRVIDGFGHGWPNAENERVWEFLEGKRLGEENNAATGKKLPPVTLSPTDAADAWNVVEMGVLADDFQIELPSERGDPDVVFGDGLALRF